MEKVIVREIQTYIIDHIDEALSLQKIAKAVNYSPYYISRLFKRNVGISLFEYVRKIRLTESAKKLRDQKAVKIVDVAFDFYFDSHEGFTRAFSKEFKIRPKDYQQHPIPIKYFVPYLIDIQKGEEKKMKTKTIFVQIVERPKRKAVILRGKKANDYFEYGNEVGCDVWGILTSIKEALHEPIGMWLSDALRKENTSRYVQGVEVPFDYSGVIPESFELVELPETKVLMFNGEPYDDVNFREAISDAMSSIEAYDPKVIGYEYDPNGYRFQYEPQGNRGYIEGITIKAVK